MAIGKTLQLAAGGVALFAAGALVTAAATGRLPMGGGLDRPAVERVVHDYLLSHPELMAQMANQLDSRQAAADDKARNDALAQVGPAALLDPKVAYVTGPSNAKVTVAEFFDYRCPHCKASMAAVENLLNKNVRVAFIEHPILTPDSLIAAKAAVAARRQGEKYVPFHFALMATSGELPKARVLDIAKSVGLDADKLAKDMEDPAVLESVKASNALADRLHFDGTPTFVINNRIVVGELTKEELQSLTEAAPKG
jgi:protein-disulfide isomerase